MGKHFIIPISTLILSWVESSLFLVTSQVAAQRVYKCTPRNILSVEVVYYDDDMFITRVEKLSVETVVGTFFWEHTTARAIRTNRFWMCVLQTSISLNFCLLYRYDALWHTKPGGVCHIFSRLFTVDTGLMQNVKGVCLWNGLGIAIFVKLSLFRVKSYRQVQKKAHSDNANLQSKM